jgi:ADP-ribose pyrophosphatase YjhB (NUDIX family)
MKTQQVFEYYPRHSTPAGEFKLCPFCGTSLQIMESDGNYRAACPACGFVHHRNPAPTVSILVIDGDRILLGKRGSEPGKGAWSLPSGYIEYEDDFLTTAIQEVKQETGLEVEVRSILNVVSSFVSPRFHFLGVYVVARVVGGEAKAGDDLEAVEWFPVKGPLPEMGFAEDVSLIELYRGGCQGIPVDAGYARNPERGGLV